MKVNDMIKVHFYSGSNEIKTRNFDKIFNVYKKIGKLGIDWNNIKNKVVSIDSYSSVCMN